MAGKLNCPPIVRQGLQHEKDATNSIRIAIGCRKALTTSTSGGSFLTISGAPNNWFIMRWNDVSLATNRAAMLAAAFVSILSVFAWTKTNPRGEILPKASCLIPLRLKQLWTCYLQSPPCSANRFGVSQRPCSYHIYLRLLNASLGTLEHFEIHITNTSQLSCGIILNSSILSVRQTSPRKVLPISTQTKRKLVGGGLSKTKECHKLVSTEDNAYFMLPQQPRYIQTLKVLVSPNIES